MSRSSRVRVPIISKYRFCFLLFLCVWPPSRGCGDVAKPPHDAQCYDQTMASIEQYEPSLFERNIRVFDEVLAGFNETGAHTWPTRESLPENNF